MEIKGMVITGLSDDELAIAMAAAEKAVKVHRDKTEAISKLKQIKDLVKEIRALGYCVEGGEIGGRYEPRKNTSFTADELTIRKACSWE